MFFKYRGVDMQGQYAEAEARLERSQAIRESVLGPEHPGVAPSLNLRAGLLLAQVRAVSIRIQGTFCVRLCGCFDTH